MPQMNLRVGSTHLNTITPRNAMILVLSQQVTLNRPGKRGPATAGVELVPRREQRLAADDIHVNAGLELLVILVDERAFSSGVLRDRELLERQVPDTLHVLLAALHVRNRRNRHMAVAAGIVDQIILMMGLGRVEIA